MQLKPISSFSSCAYANRSKESVVRRQFERKDMARPGGGNSISQIAQSCQRYLPFDNMHRTLILIYSFICLSSCAQMATIEKPLPEKEKALQSFPIDIQGDFLNSEDNSILTITDSSVIRRYDFDIKLLKDSIGYNHYIRNDTMFNKYSDEIEKIKMSGDTIIQHIHETIPLFKISDKNVLKKHKGHYFLNNRFNDSDWIVTVLSIRKGIMTVQGIQEIDIDKLEDLTNTNADTASFDINLIKKPLRNVLIQNGIGRNNYLRLRDNGR